MNNWVTDHSNDMQEFTKPRTPVSEYKDRRNLSNVKSVRSSEICLSDIAPNKNEESDNSVLLSQSCTVNEQLLKGIIEILFLSFCVLKTFEKITCLCVHIHIHMNKLYIQIVKVLTSLIS